MTNNGSIPVRELIARADALFAMEEIAASGAVLREGLARTRSAGDRTGELGLLNELMGYYRKTREQQPAMQAVFDGFALLESLGLDGSVTAATTWLNGATTMKAFGLSRDAAAYYKKARRIYETNLARTDTRLSGLYNNMALCLVDLHQYGDAEALYLDALAILHASSREKNMCDIANTYMNMAYLYEAWDKLEKEEECVDKCEAALDLQSPLFAAASSVNPADRNSLDYEKAEDEGISPDGPAHDGYYAFTCRKCAPGFAHFGRFMAAKECNERADAIYERNRRG